MNSENVIEMLHITKEFPGIIANDDITLQLRKGEIHALLGENGAGKSTLMSVLFGLYQPEAGVIKKNGEVVKINNPNDATALGIGMVHQHFKLIDVFTVLDNIILGVNSAAITLTLPASPEEGQLYFVKSVSSGNITLAVGSSAHKINDGRTNRKMAWTVSGGQILMVVWDRVNSIWHGGYINCN